MLLFAVEKACGKGVVSIPPDSLILEEPKVAFSN